MEVNKGLSAFLAEEEGAVGAEAVAGEVELCCFIQACGQGIGPGIAPRGVGAPTGGFVPAVAPAGGVGVDGDEEDVAFAEAPADFVHSAAALREGDVGLFRNQEGGVAAESCEALRGYAKHPAHVAVANTKVRPYTVQRACLDFEI